MGNSLQKRLEGAADLISQALEETGTGQAAGNSGSAGLIDKIKDNIAYVLGLPAAFSGAFGFLWQSSGEEAALDYKVGLLEEAVAELKAENDLLGGGTKNFSLDMSGAPGGSTTAIIVGACLVLFIGLLFWYQNKRKRQ
ncbi:MAG: hypothetical protein HOD58_01700 [Gammaproteobacteria bacterium]|jgi:hypothetical protein|nr:hypothetical protein [Gammaproteobacteria bacterium]MBT6199039.1 hypothetical protein [Bacteroidetes Order II. bacterium]